MLDTKYDYKKVEEDGETELKWVEREKPLENGNVITVEPGLYFANYGVGVRIEDDVLVTNDGAIVLSKNIAKEMGEVERLMASRG